MKFDSLLNGKIRLAQAATGHRAGTDAVLLAATLSPGFSGRVIDAGAATGAVGLMVAARAPLASVTLIEIDPAEAALARLNIAENGFEGRVTMAQGDLYGSFADREAQGLTQAEADCVLTNPPFLDGTATRPSPDADRQRAHSMPEGGLTLWLKACAAMLRPRGSVIMIHRADALESVLKACEGRLGGLIILPVHPHADAPASRILVSGVKASRAPLTILPGLVLHQADGRFTPFAEALHRGTVHLPSLYPTSG